MPSIYQLGEGFFRFVLKKMQGFQLTKVLRILKGSLFRRSKSPAIVWCLNSANPAVAMFHSQMGNSCNFQASFFRSAPSSLYGSRELWKDQTLRNGTNARKVLAKKQVNGTLPPPSELWLVQSSTRTHDVFGICTYVMFELWKQNWHDGQSNSGSSIHNYSVFITIFAYPWMSIFGPSRHETWWMTVSTKTCTVKLIWKRNASPLPKKHKKRMSKAHLSHDCSVKRISICWDFTPKKMGGESCLVMNVLWVTYADTQGVNHPRLNLKSMRIQKSVKTQRIWWIRWGGITPWQIITCKNNKRQVLFHVRSPTSGNKLLGK